MALSTSTISIFELDLHLKSICQVSFLHLQPLQRNRANEILLTQQNKHTSTCQNTHNHLYDGPHCKTCIQNHFFGLLTHRHVENNTSFRHCAW